MSVPLAWRNLGHQRSKLILHICGIAATLALIALLVGLRDGMYASLTAYVENTGADLIVSQLGVEGLFSTNSAIPAALHEGLAEDDEILEVGHILVADVIFTHGSTRTPVVLVGHNIETGIGGPWNIGEGRVIQNNDEILLDTWLAWRSGIAVGDKVTLLGRDFNVVGLTRETSSWMSPYVFVSQHAAEDILQLAGIASFYLLRLPKGIDLAAVKADLESRFAGITALTPDEMATADRRVAATMLDTPINVMLGISAAIGVGVMGIITYSSILAKLKEYSVLKAVGASGGWLLRLVAKETIYRTIMGFIVGTGLAYLVAELIMRTWPQFTIVIQLETIVIMGMASLIMALIAALWPIRRLAGLDPASVFKA